MPVPARALEVPPPQESVTALRGMLHGAQLGSMCFCELFGSLQKLDVLDSIANSSTKVFLIYFLVAPGCKVTTTLTTLTLGPMVDLFVLSPLLATPEEITIFCGVGLGWGGARERSACGGGWGGVGHVNVRLHLRHEVDASCLMWGGVGWGMLTFACTCVTKLMLRG